MASGRHAGIHGTYLGAFRRVVVAFALHTDIRVDYVDITLGNGAYRTFRQTDSTSYTIIANF